MQSRHQPLTGEKEALGDFEGSDVKNQRQGESEQGVKEGHGPSTPPVGRRGEFLLRCRSERDDGAKLYSNGHLSPAPSGFGWESTGPGESAAPARTSCADILAEDGEVHVALCRGQGGTPADKPQREWHNSWQVVAMAALGGLILSDVLPFSCDAVPGYKCTGYRSQDKPFHVEGALNHVFTRSLPFEDSKPRIFRIKLGDKCFSFLEPEALAGKLNRGFLEASSCHPIKTINEKLIAGLGSAFPLKMLKCSCPLLQQESTSVFPSWNSDILSAFWVNLYEHNLNCKSLVDETQEITESLVSFSDRIFARSPRGNGNKEAPEGICEPVKVCLRSSLLVHVQAVIQAPDFLPGSLNILSGPVFRKCHISPFTMPAFHETLVIFGVNQNLKHHCLLSLLDHLKATLESLLTQTLLEDAKLSSSVEFALQPNGIDYMIHVKSPKFGLDCAKDLIIGSVITSAISITHKDQCFVIISINLDLLTMLIWNISDWRILWTFDNRFLKNFVPEKIAPFKSYSLYPPCYVHDISFWLNEKKGFDELEFHTVARAVSQDTITSIQLLGRFQHPKTGQISLCYRLTYQTCDKALTQQQVALRQLQFRKEIQQQLHVTPR
ncbi:ferredoxin-fold anticodon-binding domain-containing protein 1 isoform X2 [Cavia porcellus]|uniref:ferredoxin-fold anticodon-binding domain-containing protein 1 isoform X2 n=1 Tax=Cavia porcellus TaxID=10141 RepID=UPI000661DA3E|nr:ferredoxin-fold anticodon-binding domain-containing protein 1 isoform X2 [Cavia porcellus]